MRYGAYALVEVLGAANAVQVIDRMLKAADVEFVAKHTRCGGHSTVIMGGSTSSAKAAIEVIQAGVSCEVVASAVISSPSEELADIVDQWSKGIM